MELFLSEFNVSRGELRDIREWLTEHPVPVQWYRGAGVLPDAQSMTHYHNQDERIQDQMVMTYSTNWLPVPRFTRYALYATAPHGLRDVGLAR